MKEQIRPLYSELQGYLRAAPPVPVTFSSEIVIAQNYNAVIDRIAAITGKQSGELDRFKVIIQPPNEYHKRNTFQTFEYRSKLTGFITNLHGEYFSDEPAPFAGMPSTVIHQTQQQSQTVDIQLLLDIGSKIERELPNHEDGSKEKKFLQRVKDTLGGITSSAQLFSQALNAAREFGISPEDISRLLGF